MKILKAVRKRRPPGKTILETATREGRKNLLETESRELLHAYGIKVPEARLARDQKEAIESAEDVGRPIAMKVVCPDILHKSDVGGVKLGLEDSHQVGRAFGEIMKAAEKVTHRSRVLGMLISPMAPPGQECIIGMIRDRQFGPVLMFGLGGIFVETLKDVSFRVAPLTHEDIDAMVREVKAFGILTGTRGEKPKDISAIKDVIAKLSEMAIDHPEIREVDLNPVIVHEKGASIVDARVIVGASNEPNEQSPPS